MERVGNRVGIISMEGFIFFASASQIIRQTKQMLAESDTRKPAEQLRYMMYDFEHVDSCDFSGIRTFFDLRRILKNKRLTVVFTGLTEKLREKFANEDILDPEDSWMVEYEDLDRGAEYIEDTILERAAKLRQRWMLYDSFQKIHSEAQLKLKFELPLMN